MKKAFPVIAFLLLAVSGTCWHGCNESDCPLNTAALAHFSFLSGTDHAPLKWDTTLTVTGFTEADVTVRDTLADGTVQESIVKDSLLEQTLYNQESGLGSLSLPLSYGTRTTYVIHYTQRLRDTIVVTHRNIPFVSNIECGAMMFYQVEEVKYTTRSLDSVVIVNPDIDNEEKENFYIYYTK